MCMFHSQTKLNTTHIFSRLKLWDWCLECRLAFVISTNIQIIWLSNDAMYMHDVQDISEINIER